MIIFFNKIFSKRFKMSDLSMNAHHAHQHKKLLGNDLLGSGVFGFAIVVLIVFMILSFFKPEWVLRNDGKYHSDTYSHGDDCRDGEVDCMKALLYSVLITVGIAVVLGLLAYAFSC